MVGSSAAFPDVAISAPDQQERKSISSLIRLSTKAHLIFLAIAIIYFFCINVYYELDFYERVTKVFFGFIGLTTTSLLIGGINRYYTYVTVTRPHHPFVQLARDLRDLLKDKRRMSLILPTMISISIFMETFRKAKVQIAGDAVTGWDQLFTQLDRYIHFGKLPWEWLQPVLGYPVVTFLVNVNYNSWILVMWSVWIAYAFSNKHRAVRTRFLISFMLIWSLGGTVAATMLASVGPCYYDKLHLVSNPYASLMSYLHQTNEILPLWALNVQSLLWQGKLGEAVPLGISAMPSMHNASVMLLVLASASFGRATRWALIIHAVFVFLGSIHLGWHYAVDAYAAWVITIVIWLAVAPIARWWDGLPATKAYQASLARAATA